MAKEKNNQTPDAEKEAAEKAAAEKAAAEKAAAEKEAAEKEAAEKEAAEKEAAEKEAAEKEAAEKEAAEKEAAEKEAAEKEAAEKAADKNKSSEHLKEKCEVVIKAKGTSMKIMREVFFAIEKDPLKRVNLVKLKDTPAAREMVKSAAEKFLRECTKK